MQQQIKNKSEENLNDSVWVSANAGTGKTYQLTQRILKLLIHGNKPEKILCITYTNAAANEMHNRIIEEASKLILANDANLEKELKNLAENKILKLNQVRKNLEYVIDSPDKLKIQTIHSFCQSILKKFPLEANIAPFFDVIDEIKQSQILQKIWEETQVNINSQSFEELIKFTSITTIKKNIFNLTLQRKNFENLFLTNENYQAYKERLKEKLNITYQTTESLFFNFTDSIISEISVCIKHSQEKKLHKSNSIIKGFILFLSEKTLKSLRTIIYDSSGKLREVENKYTLKIPELLIEMMNICQKIEKFFEDYKNHLNYYNTIYFLEILRLFIQNYENFKTKNHLLDYEDLISKASDLLNDNNYKDWVLYKLDGGIDHILLDEAQDTSEKQWKIINSISEEFFSGETKKANRTLFVVGDEKQSIYSFQGADIQNYFKVKERLKNYTKKINLDTSRRSLKAILELTDEVFKNPGLKSMVTNESLVSHNTIRTDHLGYVEIFKPVEYTQAKKNYTKKGEIKNWELKQEYSEPEEDKNRILLAKNISTKVHEILNSNKTLPCLNGEKIEPKDIMIIIKKRGILSNEIAKNLKDLNIRVADSEKSNTKENLLILDIISAIKFCLNQSDDLNLACLLKSFLFNLSEENLFEICYNRKESVFENTAKKLPDIYQELYEILKLYKTHTSIYTFILTLLEKKNYKEKCINLFGKQKLKTALEFLEKIKQFETEENISNEALISYLENSTIYLKNKINEHDNSVKIMTVHGSKGLQSGIVIIANALDFETAKDEYVFNSDYIIIPPTTKNSCKLYKEIQHENSALEYSEYFRLLYVALTRAKDELYIFSANSKSKKTDAKAWYNFILEAAKNLDYSENENSLIKTDDNYIIYCSNTDLSKPEKGIIIDINKYKDQRFNFHNTEILSPSKFLNANKLFNNKKPVGYEYGIAIHKLLQYLPDYKINKIPLEILIDEFNFNEETKLKLTNEYIKLTEDIKVNELLAMKHKSEVDVAGFIDGKFISGRIDRLVWKNDNEIFIIDYKTNRDAEENEAKLLVQYKSQMNLYKQLIEKIYPNKIISAVIIFTVNAKIIYL